MRCRSLTTSLSSRPRVAATEGLLNDLVADMPVSTNAVPNRYIMLFDAWSAAKGSKKAVITPVRITDIGHGICKIQCGRQYTTCSHACSEACYRDKPCRLCLEPCEVRCSHSRCSKKCHEPCVPCVENCSWSCPHQGACKLPYAVPCDLLPYSNAAY